MQTCTMYNTSTLCLSAYFLPVWLKRLIPVSPFQWWLCITKTNTVIQISTYQHLHTSMCHKLKEDSWLFWLHSTTAILQCIIFHSYSNCTLFRWHSDTEIFPSIADREQLCPIGMPPWKDAKCHKVWRYHKFLPLTSRNWRCIQVALFNSFSWNFPT